MFCIGMAFMNKYTLLCLSMITTMSYTNFITNGITQYQAKNAFTKNDFLRAQQKYTTLLEANPYDSETNYNLGLTFFKQKNFPQALNCFSRSIEHCASNNFLKEQALFNKGNTLVELNELEKATHAYQDVLSLNLKNENARHNLEIVKKLLETQKQENNKQDQDQNDKNKQNQNNNDKQNQEQNNKQNDDKDTKQQSDSTQSDSKNQNQEQQSNHNEKDQEKKQNNQLDEQSQKQKEQNKDKNNEHAHDHDRNQQQQKPDQQDKQETQYNKLDEKTKEPKQHDLSSQKETTQQKKDNQASLKDQDKKDQDEDNSTLQNALAQELSNKDNQLDQKSAKLIKALDQHEQNIQKQLIQMNVTKQGAFQYGQKNW